MSADNRSFSSLRRHAARSWRLVCRTQTTGLSGVVRYFVRAFLIARHAFANVAVKVIHCFNLWRMDDLTAPHRYKEGST